MKKLSLSLLLILVGLTSFAQSSKVSSAITYLENGELDRAKEAIELAAVNEKTAIQAKTWFYRGRIYSAIGFDQTGKYSGLSATPFEEAMTSFNHALTLPDVKNLKRLMLAEYGNLQMGFFNQAAQAYGNKDYQKAHDAFSLSSEANLKQVEIEPTLAMDTGVIFNVGLCAERLGNTEEAMGIYQRLVNMKYNEPYVYQALSEMYASQGKIDEAIQVISDGRRAYPKDQALIITELNFYLTQGKVTEIVDKLNEAISLDPNNVELYFAQGNAYGELMKTAVIEGGTPSASVIACLGQPEKTEELTGKGEGAQKWTYGSVTFNIVEGKVSDIEGSDKNVKALTEKCNDKAKYDDYLSKAVASYKKAIEINPSSFDNYLNLGALYYNTAIEINKKMINLPLDADKEYAELEARRSGLYKDALPYFEKAHELDPTNIPTMQALKEIYAKTGNFEKMNAIKKALGE
jgi:tetratricopeptide (TPR) repeat protein